MLKLIPLLLICILLPSCQTSAEKFSLVADGFSFSEATLTTPYFQHRIFINTQALQKSPTSVLHVYLDGDGSPWQNKHWISKDPTSKNPIILKLMSLDSSPAVLLGRPCYHGLSQTPHCHFKHWTTHRYSQQVVTSLALALNLWLQKHPTKNINLIGFSGGGTLAMLVAPLIENATKVVTIAANLDVAAWSKHHGYSALVHSLNPIDLPQQKQLRQFHLVGKNDAMVPSSTLQNYIHKHPNAEMIKFNNFNHHCCWIEIWGDIINTILDAQL